MKEKIVLAGGGGHCKVVIDAIKKQGGFDIHGVVDPSLQKGTKVLGVPVIGNDEVLPEVFNKGVRYAFVSVGSVGKCGPRKRLYGKLKKMKYILPTVVHPKAIVADDVELGEGTFIAAGAVVNPGTKIGKNAIINTSASVDHDCTIGDFVHIAPNATLSGGVVVGEETHIGTGATVVQYKTIGKRCMIRMGKAAYSDMTNGSKL